MLNHFQIREVGSLGKISQAIPIAAQRLNNAGTINITR